MRLSFVIPTRNQARFIRRTVDSCLSQRISDSEIIVVDGVSTDGTQDILKSYGERIRWTSEPDSGQSEAVNKGVARARGEVIAWINSDDYYADDSVLRDVLAAYDSDPSVDIVYGSGRIVDEDGRLIRPHRTRELTSPNDVLVTPNGPSMQPATFFRRRLFLEVGGLRNDLHFAMDYDLWLRLFPKARTVRFLRRPLACATFHAGAKSIYGMATQIRELGELKRRYRDRFRLGPVDRMRLSAGMLFLHAYRVAVKLGLRRVA